MKNETDHPCNLCKHFAGYVDVITFEELHIGIPMCQRLYHTMTIGRCDKFVPKEVQMSLHPRDDT